MGDRWLLTVHVEDTSAEIAHHVDHLLLGESIRSKLHQKVEEGSIRAKLTHNADLAAARSGLMDLGIVHHHDVVVSAQLPLHEPRFQKSQSSKLFSCQHKKRLLTQTCISLVMSARCS